MGTKIINIVIVFIFALSVLTGCNDVSLSERENWNDEDDLSIILSDPDKKIGNMDNCNCDINPSCKENYVVCHIPGDNIDAMHIICVGSKNAEDVHQKNHGDIIISPDSVDVTNIEELVQKCNGL